MDPLNSTVSPVLLTPLQQAVKDKLSATVEQVISAVNQTTRMIKPDFVAIHVTPLQAPLSLIDDRTNIFFQMMMVAINERLEQVPTLVSALSMLGKYFQHADLRNELVQGVALQPIQELIKEFDEMNTSIVDDMISRSRKILDETNDKVA
jgi:hypothetical protein